MKKKIIFFIVALLLVASFGFSQLTGQYFCGETAVNVAQIKPQLKVINTSGSPVDLSSVTIRYYFQELGTSTYGFNVDYAAVGTANITGSFSDGYVEVGFLSAAGTIANGADSGEIQLRINKSDWTNFDQSDDYSFDPSITSFTDFSKITVYLDGVQVWGEGPIEGTPTESPEPTNTPTPYSGTVSTYGQRFLDLWNDIHDPANGYFSPVGAPYHCDVTVVSEAPDHGHESTSEAYSYYIWLEVMYGRLTGDWSQLDRAWEVVESQIIPGVQPGNEKYDPSSPASYAAEWDTPDEYPTLLKFDTPVGIDPISDGLVAAYGTKVYGMHWLLDCDNFYGYGGTNWNGNPVFINTFQRGIEESTYETIPHPSIEEFKWGGPNGFLDLFTIDESYAKQWRYTTAPDAEARIIQAMYWAKEAGYTGSGIEKAAKMGDFMRLAFFDKYFKPIAEDTNENSAGTGYDSCHYLISWYYSWGGGLDGNWAWRIGSSHMHHGYQNVMAAWVMANDPAFAGSAQGCTTDWSTSLDRSIEFLQWLQSADGLFGGGATNSWKGRYAAYPAGKSTFYGLAYDEDPVYEDPSSNEWFGMQAWGPERLCEYYYVTGDQRAKDMLDKYFEFIQANVILEDDGTFRIPVTLAWSGEPDTWTGTPSANSNLRVTLASTEEWDARKNDVDMSSCLAKGLAYYAAGTEKYGTLNQAAKDLAYEILERNWNNYRDESGLGIPEEPWFLERWMTQEVYVPAGWTGTMANGDVIEPGITFQDIRTDFRNDTLGAELIDMYNNGTMEPYTTHRFWGEVDAATAYLVYDEMFGSLPSDPTPTPVEDPTPTPIEDPIYTLGDVNEDGIIDIVDALLIAQKYVDLSPAAFTAPDEAGDVNIDGIVDIVDALLTAQYYVGILTQLPPV